MVQLLNHPKTAVDLSLQNGSVFKTFQILEQFTRKNPQLTLNEIASRAEINRSTTFRFLNSLRSLGIVERSEEGHYKLGMRLFELGILVDVNQSISEKAQPFLRELSNDMQESSCLVIRDRVDVLCLVNEESVQSIRIDFPVGSRNPMYCTATGKAILAFMDEEFIDLYCDITELKSRTSHTITSAAKLRRELEDVRGSLVSYNVEEFADDVFCVGTPVFDINEYPVAAISLSGLKSRMINQKAIISEAVLHAGQSITREIGGRYPDRESTKQDITMNVN
ncbi:MAG: IclR family transcriptional regulator [Candidatus Marinimicrobia bacterium]|jgi:DNA-binding IclR family transcriptional regulator|nr:IclR family transcriptional regulator [Candidatus Neomarinimicrobiota bacterium]|tara:strand:+ start:450 stop:1289 length:840 start_codon:yes stop_codon:yes gene_type:complete